MTNGRLQEAEENRRRAIELAPQDGTLWSILGKAMAQAGRYPEAADYLRKALDVLPQRNDLHPLLVDALIGAGRYDDARTEIEACRAAVIWLPQELIDRAMRQGGISP